MNSEVLVATGEFAEWMGRSVHVQGDFFFDEVGAVYGSDVVRIN